MTRVLLLERDPATRDRLALALRRARFELRSAGDAEGGLRLVAEAVPDVVVVGHGLADMTLAQACDAARAAVAGRALGIVALLPPGAAAAADLRQALLDGADDALPHGSPDDAVVEAVHARGPCAPAGPAARRAAHSSAWGTAWPGAQTRLTTPSCCRRLTAIGCASRKSSSIS